MKSENRELEKRLESIEKHLCLLYRSLMDRAPQEAQRVDGRFMTARAAADYINKSVHTLYRYTSKNTVPHYKQGGKVYFLREELEAWVRSGGPKTGEEPARGAREHLRVRKKQ